MAQTDHNVTARAMRVATESLAPWPAVDKFGQVVIGPGLSFPVPGSWDLYIWDQGAVAPDFSYSPTNRMYGLRVDDIPGKFVIHAPQIRGGYPTRNGLGRQLAYWITLKLVATRGAPKYL